MALPESPGHPPAGIETVVWNDPHVGHGHGFVEFVRVVDDEATLLVTAAALYPAPCTLHRMPCALRHVPCAVCHR